MSLKTKSLIIFAAASALSAGFWMSSIQQDSIDESAKIAKEKALADARQGYSPINGRILSPARKISIPALVKDDGETLTIDDLKGQWNLLFFGYTHCPDVCPTTMDVLAQAKKKAITNNHMFPKVIFVSVDPERDKVEMLSKYVQYFDEDFIGVTGEQDLIKALTLQMSVVYMKMPAEQDSEENNYLVDHSSSLLLVNPEGKLVAFLKAPHDVETVLKDFQTVVNKSN